MDCSIPRSRWVVAALAAVAALTICVALRKISGADYWWQWKTGELVAASGVPRFDSFSFTRSGHEWLEFRWLFCLGLYELTTAFGHGAAVIAQCIVTLATFAVALLSAPRSMRQSAWAPPVLMLAVLASSQRMFVRPEMVTFLLLALYALLIVRWRARQGRGGSIWVVPLLQIVWVNAHTTSVIGLVTVALFVVAETIDVVLARRRGRHRSLRRVRTSTLVLLLTLSASLLNPYGVRGLLFPLQLFAELRGTVFKEAIVELRSPFTFSQRTPALAVFDLLIAVTLLSALLNWRRLDSFRGLLTAAMLYLAATAVRNLPLFAVAAIPFILTNVGRTVWLARPRSVTMVRAMCGFVTICCAAICWMLVTGRFYVWRGDPSEFGAGIATRRYPQGAVEFIKSQHLSGPLFNTVSEGGYLIANDVKVFIDSRFEVYGETMYAQYSDAVSHRDAWRAVVQQYDLRVALVDVASHAVNIVGEDREWRVVYFDDVAAVFVRDDANAATVPASDIAAMAAAARAVLPDAQPAAGRSLCSRVTSPAPYQRLGGFLLMIHQPALAIPVLRDATLSDPSSAYSHRLLAMALQQSGDSRAARQSFEEALRLDPDDATVQLAIGMLLVQDGEFARARRLLASTAATNPNEPRAWFMLGAACLEQQDFTAAQQAFENVVRISPRNREAWKGLIEAARNQRHVDVLRQHVTRALALFPGDPEFLEVQQTLDALPASQ